ncbi:MAG: lyase family protein, partial [Thermomicrobiales bacterium]
MQDNHNHNQNAVSLTGLIRQDTSMTPPRGAPTQGTNRTPALRCAVVVMAAHLVMLQDHGVIDGHGFDAVARALDSAQDGLLDAEALPARRLLGELAARVDAQTPTELSGASTLGLAREEWLTAIVRLTWRDAIDAALEEVLGLRASLIDLADAHVVTIMPAFAGHRASQPTNLGHLLGGVIVPLRSASQRLFRARAAIDRSPLGAGILAGDMLALDRERQAEVIGFASPVGNTLDAVMSVEDLVEAAEAVGAAVAPVRRLLRELGSWMRSDPDSFLLADRWQTQPEPVNPLVVVPEPIDTLIRQIAAIEDRCRIVVARLREVAYGPVGGLADAL